MPAAIPIAIAVAAASSVYQGVEANQQKQHAIGAAQAEQTAMNSQIASADKANKDATDRKSAASGANMNSALAAVKASNFANSGFGGTLLTGPQGAGPAQVQQKTLLGG